ncbi:MULTISPECIES: phage portal protein [Nocardia]|uniref:phage portal protein n=1 Tax=Nocardia TaxID=1817 RepID=UPI000D685C5A|nr:MULTISPECIES: hypothetical protein [Nocardia]
MADPVELTPDQWLEYLMNKLDEDLEREPRVTTGNTPTTRRERLDLLWSYYLGDPPLPTVAEKYRETFSAVLRKARSNYAIMAIDSMCDRSVLQGIYTAADADLNGDDAAKAVCDASGFAALQRDMQTWLYTMGESYVTIVPPLAGAPTGTPPMLLAEDPRFCVGEPDPYNPRMLRAFLKIFVDKIADQQKAILLIPGQRIVFTREKGQYSNEFVAKQWSAEPATSVPGLELLGGVPVVRFQNKMGLGEFEPHLDLLDRITDGILHRMVITAFQSFKQRAVKGDLDGGADFSEDTDSLIKSIADAELTDIFQNDPGVLWMLPEGVELWESGTTDLTPLLMATRDDVKEFGVCTRIPMHMLIPDGVSQSAEGASAMREGLIDKISDRQARQNPQWILLWQMIFTLMGKTNVTGIRLQWGKPERVSLSSKTDAVQKTRGVLSRKRQVVDLMEMSPELAALNESELLEEAMASDAAMSALSLGSATAADPADSATDPAASPAEKAAA